MAWGAIESSWHLRTEKLCRVSLQKLIVHCRKSSAVAFVWGAGDGGQLGTSDNKTRLEPLKIGGSGEEQATHIGCGHGFTFVSHKNLKYQMLMSAKYGVIGQLKRNETHKINSQVTAAASLPVLCENAQVTQISCGRDHVAALTNTGDVFVSGSNNLGQCGGGKKEDVKQFDLISKALGQIKQVACGLDHTLFLTADGKVFSCGMGADGQTGLGHFDNEWNVSEVVGDITGIKIKQVSAAADSCLAVSEDGDVFSWGNNEYGQLANGSHEPQVCIATRAVSLQDLGPIAEVAAAGAYCAVLTAVGDVYTWGFGVLGHGPGDHISRTPKKVITSEEIGDRLLHLYCGIEHTAIITESGKLLVWGRGSYGRLGIGKTTDLWTPVQVRLPGRVLEVSCGVDHMGAIVELS